MRLVPRSRPGRRALAVVLTLVSSLAWGVASGPRGDPVGWLADLSPTAVSAGIKAGRPAGYPIGGIDLSSHDHERYPVRWRTEITAGSRFVYIKATEGTTYVNPHFAADYVTARAAYRAVGAYVYARPDLGDPVGQAEHFLRHARFSRDARTLVPFVDLEWPWDGVHTGPCYNLTPEQMRGWIRAFVDRIRAGIGRKPMIYTNANWWNPCTGYDPSYGAYPLDIAGYSRTPPRLPAGWATFILWQYLPGDPARPDSHDRDVVNGGMAALTALAWPPRD